MADDEVVEALVGAAEALGRADGEGALEALLRAWRETREPRVAELVERVSADVTAARPAIAAKSVKERTAAVVALAKRKNPRDLGRILEAPWPGRWQDALPVLEALRAFPADPRLAVALARVVAEGAYDTWTSHRFYEPLLARVASLGDARAVPILEEQRNRQRSTYWGQGTGPAIEQAIERLRARPREALSAPSERALAALEARFAHERRAEAAKARGEAEFVADILARPDDLALRQVFADFLTERGDPRGEHIALGLARREGRADEKMLRREAALAKKHGPSWAGPLDALFSKDGRIYDLGFLAEGTLELVSPRTYGRIEALPDTLHDPGLATLRALALGGREASDADVVARILALPALAGVRALRGLGTEALTVLGSARPRPAVEELDAQVGDEPWARAALADGCALPGLRRLALEASAELDWFFATPAARRLERFTLRSYEYPIGAVVACAERHALPLRELGFAERSGMRGPDWTFVLRRGPSGRFDDLEGRSDGVSRVPSVYDLVKALENVPEGTLRRFAVPPHESVPYADGHIARAEEALARFPDAQIDVPWRRPTREARAQAVFSLDLHGAGLGAGEHLDRALALVQAPPLSLRFDAFAVDHGKHQVMAHGPAETIRAAFEKKRPSHVALYEESDPRARRLEVRKGGGSLSVALPWRGFAAFVDEALPFARALIEGQVDVAGAGHLWTPEGSTFSGYVSCRALGHVSSLCFSNVLAPPVARLLRTEALAALDGRAGLPRVRVVPAGEAAILVVGDGGMPSEAELAALDAALAGLVDDGFAAVRGFRPSALAREVLGDRLRAAGFEEEPAAEIDASLGNRAWRCDAAAGPRRVQLELNHPVGEAPTFFVWLEEVRGVPGGAPRERRSLVRYREDADRFPVSSADAARASFGWLAEHFDRAVLAWFDEPLEKPRRRR